MKLNIKELLDFFDDKKDSFKGDANAIMSILGEDLNSAVYKHFRKNKVEILEDSVVSGMKKGKWLDKWMLDGKTLYQCEIKNWASTSLLGKQLRSDASEEEIKEVVKYHWDHELNIRFSKKVEHPNNVTKVLLKMKPPKELNKLKIEPLVIYWMPISSSLNPLSVLPIKTLHLPIKTEFSELQIFSVSLYLHQLYKNGKGEKFIELDMPHFEHRMKILNKLQNK